jgi:hypothetical protein
MHSFAELTLPFAYAQPMLRRHLWIDVRILSHTSLGSEIQILGIAEILLRTFFVPMQCPNTRIKVVDYASHIA